MSNRWCLRYHSNQGYGAGTGAGARVWTFDRTGVEVEAACYLCRNWIWRGPQYFTESGGKTTQTFRFGEALQPETELVPATPEPKPFQGARAGVGFALTFFSELELEPIHFPRAETVQSYPGSVFLILLTEILLPTVAFKLWKSGMSLHCTCSFAY